MPLCRCTATAHTAAKFTPDTKHSCLRVFSSRHINKDLKAISLIFTIHMFLWSLSISWVTCKYDTAFELVLAHKMSLSIWVWFVLPHSELMSATRIICFLCEALAGPSTNVTCGYVTSICNKKCVLQMHMLHNMLNMFQERSWTRASTGSQKVVYLQLWKGIFEDRFRSASSLYLTCSTCKWLM